MIPRYDGEKQRHYIERAFRAHGSIRTYDCLYELAYRDGRKCSITRLAAIVFELRADGWDIATSGGKGETAIYTLRYCPPLREVRVTKASLREPLDLEPVPAIAEVSLPEWARSWRCSDCGGRPAAEPVAMLGDLGRAHCAVCRTPRLFRRAAA